MTARLAAIDPRFGRFGGLPQAINAGDAMFTLAATVLQGLPARGLLAERTLEAYHIFDETCLRLTEGQYLDMSFENRMDVHDRRGPGHDRWKDGRVGRC